MADKPASLPLPAALPAPVVSRHRQFNRNSENRWEAFAGHRLRVTGLLQAAAGPAPQKLAVLGAGNCNDLDLAALGTSFTEIHLFDLDDEALGKAPTRQGRQADATLLLHAPIDVTGALPALAGFAKKPPAAAEIDQLADAAVTRAAAQLGGPYDVVLSACLLSQIMHSSRLALGADNPALPEVAHQLVIAHLRTLLGLTAPGGTVILATDTATSVTYPLVELFDAQPPLKLLEGLDQRDNLLSGTAPSYLRRLLARDPIAKPLLASSPRLEPPWLWNLGDDVTLLAYALVLKRAG